MSVKIQFRRGSSSSVLGEYHDSAEPVVSLTTELTGGPQDGEEVKDYTLFLGDEILGGYTVPQSNDISAAAFFAFDLLSSICNTFRYDFEVLPGYGQAWLTRYSNSTAGPYFMGRKSRGDALGELETTQEGDQIAVFGGMGINDATPKTWGDAGRITIWQDGPVTPGSPYVPGRMALAVTNSGGHQNVLILDSNLDVTMWAGRGRNLNFSDENTAHSSLVWKARTYTKASAKISTFSEGSLVRKGLQFYTGNYSDETTDPDIQMTIRGTGNVGIGTVAPEWSAILDLTSISLGFLPPRMTTTQRDAISAPATGLVIYNTTTNVLNFYNGAAWGAV